MFVKKTEFRIIYGDITNFLAEECVHVALRSKPTETSIRKCFRDIFQKAKRAKQAKVIFAAAGIEEGFPPIGVAKIVSQEILRFCRAFPGSLKEMILIVKDKKTLELFEQHVYGYLRHVQEDLGCGPYVTVDMLIELKQGLVLIERTNPPLGLALPGGFVDNGESVEAAARREAKEETNLELVDIKQFHTYSDPKRDPRFHTISTVFIAKGKGKAKFGDDAKGLKIIAYKNLLKYDYAFDHKRIIRDYLVHCQISF